MRIYFSGKLTMPEEGLMFNCLVLKHENGTTVRIDRDTTWYNIEEDGSFTMEWHSCYLWEINGDNVELYLTDDDTEYLKEYDFVELEVEDDAPDGYEVTIDEIEAEDGGIIYVNVHA